MLATFDTLGIHRGLAIAVAALGCTVCSAAPTGPFLESSANCRASTVGSTQGWTCDPFDTKKGLLMAASVGMFESSIVAVNGTASKPGTSKVQLKGTFEFDINQSSLSFPLSAIGEIVIGPISNEQNAPTLTASGGSNQTVGGTKWLKEFQGTGPIIVSAETLINSITLQPGLSQGSIVKAITAEISIVYRYVPTVGKINPGGTFPKPVFVPKANAQ